MSSDAVDAAVLAAVVGRSPRHRWLLLIASREVPADSVASSVATMVSCHRSAGNCCCCCVLGKNCCDEVVDDYCSFDVADCRQFRKFHADYCWSWEVLDLDFDSVGCFGCDSSALTAAATDRLSPRRLRPCRHPCCPREGNSLDLVESHRRIPSEEAVFDLRATHETNGVNKKT